MKKIVLISLSLFLVSAASLAQKRNIKRANRLFEKRAYTRAAELYEKKERSSDVLKNLADCYYYNSNHEKAVKTYEELFSQKSDSLENEYNFRYAQALKGVNNYKESDKYLSLYYDQPINTLDFIKETDRNTPQVFELKEIVDEGSNSDFGLSFYNELDYEEEKVVFSSSRNADNRDYAWNGLPYLDVYLATLLNDTIKYVEPLHEINTDMHESNAVFTKDGETMYFNRTSKKRVKVDKRKIAHIYIYKAELVGETWKKITKLPFSCDAYSTVHPILSSDDKFLYFASDMPDSYGGYDLYRVAINDDGTYGEPENLGSTINTPQTEQFPYISDKGVLYFSSTGHLGFGGLDVYRSDRINGVFQKPVNLGSSINSNFDDFSFVIREKDNKGFVSSNRSGSDRLYSFSSDVNPLTLYEVEGVIENKDNHELLEGASVTLLDEFDNMIKETIVGEDAYFNFKIDPHKKYKIRATKESYAVKDVEVLTDTINKVVKNIVLKPNTIAYKEGLITENEDGELHLKIEDVLFDFNDFHINEDQTSKLEVLVDLMKKYPSMEIEVEAYTDSRGSKEYNLDLSKRRAASTVDYLVSRGIDKDRIQSIGYGELKPVIKCTTGNCSEEEHQANRRSEFKILNVNLKSDIKQKETIADKESIIAKNEKGELEINLDKILFDFDKSNIREDAASKLNVLVGLMKKYPTMKVEVSAHTDVRGSNEYNLILSKHRAISTLHYLVSQGIEKSRLTSIGYGESKPIKNCEKTGACSEEDHQANRRCEFKILSL